MVGVAATATATATSVDSPGHGRGGRPKPSPPCRPTTSQDTEAAATAVQALAGDGATQEAAAPPDVSTAAPAAHVTATRVPGGEQRKEGLGGYTEEPRPEVDDKDGAYDGRYGSHVRLWRREDEPAEKTLWCAIET